MEGEGDAHPRYPETGIGYVALEAQTQTIHSVHLQYLIRGLGCSSNRIPDRVSDGFVHIGLANRLEAARLEAIQDMFDLCRAEGAHFEVISFSNVAVTPEKT